MPTVPAWCPCSLPVFTLMPVTTLRYGFTAASGSSSSDRCQPGRARWGSSACGGRRCPRRTPPAGGQISTWASSRSGRVWAATAARLPLALSPPTASTLPSPSSPLLLVAPPHRCDRVVRCRGEGVLGREPVVDRQHGGLGVSTDPATPLICGVEVADDPAAAVSKTNVGHGPLPSGTYRRAGTPPALRFSTFPTWTSVSGVTQSNVSTRYDARASSGVVSWIGG